MRLTSYTDYALRTLMFLALNRERLVTIGDIAETHHIAKNHLTKVVHQLGTLGYVETVRGRSGGLRLGREPEDIRVGDVARDPRAARRAGDPDFKPIQLHFKRAVPA